MVTDFKPSTLEQWIHLLSISTTFSIPRIRERAIREMTTNYTIDPIQKIVLGDKFGTDELKKSSYEELVQRGLKIQDDEAEILGLKTTIRINRVREQLLEEMVKDLDGAIKEAEAHMCGQSQEYTAFWCSFDYPVMEPEGSLLSNHTLRFPPDRVSHLVYEEFWRKEEKKTGKEEDSYVEGGVEGGREGMAGYGRDKSCVQESILETRG
jgi:hypothetical protein